MELNDTKFQLLQHGKSSEFKIPYTLPSGLVIKDEGEVRDLGVIVDPDLSWKPHISKIVAKANTMAAWVLRVFKTRKKEHLMTLYKTYVRSHLEYCSPVWSPYEKQDIEKIEAVQRSFTSKIEGMDDLDYWERLQALGIYSLQRRRERYKILYIWKMSRNLVPVIPGMDLEPNYNTRQGKGGPRRMAHWKAPKSVATLIHNAFASSALALFNIVPASVKEQTTIENAKAELDKFLSIEQTPRQTTNKELQYCTQQ